MKFLKIFGIGFGSILVIALIVTGSLWGLSNWNQRPRNASELELGGFKLGETKGDVEFKHGDITSGLYKNDSGELSYDIGRVNLSFDKSDKLDAIRYMCQDSKVDYTSINRISCGDSSESIKKMFKNIKQYCVIEKTNL